jgi:hypothetical protein
MFLNMWERDVMWMTLKSLMRLLVKLRVRMHTAGLLFLLLLLLLLLL